MNYIYSILLFLVMTVGSLFTAYQFPSQVQGPVFLAASLGFLSGLTTLVFILTAFFRIMGLRAEHKRRITSLDKSKKYVLLTKESFDKFKEAFHTEIMEYYPDFEKTIFSKISPENLKELKKYSADFPNTSYHKLLGLYIDKSVQYISDIEDAKERVLQIEKYIKDLEESDWYLFKVKNNG